jgi:hypothetical protein
VLKLEERFLEENISMCKSTIDVIKAAIPDIAAAFDYIETDYGIIEAVKSALDSIEGTSITVTGVPVCLSPTCSDDLDLFSVLASFISVVEFLAIDDATSDTEKAILQTLALLPTSAFEGEDCSSDNPDPNGSTTSSSSVTSKFAPAAVALGAAMFTL